MPQHPYEVVRVTEVPSINPSGNPVQSLRVTFVIQGNETEYTIQSTSSNPEEISKLIREKIDTVQAIFDLGDE